MDCSFNWPAGAAVWYNLDESEIDYRHMHYFIKLNCTFFPTGRKTMGRPHKWFTETTTWEDHHDLSCYTERSVCHIHLMWPRKGWNSTGEPIPANTRHRPNVGPASYTVAQHWFNIGWMSCVCWDLYANKNIQMFSPDVFSCWHITLTKQIMLRRSKKPIYRIPSGYYKGYSETRTIVLLRPPRLTARQ